ncbi:hypothetical protein GALMADRAFT_1310102 [Galerina marginata CBS 339.88]|uniref:Uncharacterized protein n=1 Tax=Galerina marginata (strain CBS 339.88) TaxID=685588 RepID=A0A067T536_GALM3|nr:hypothetical protein GALMADRAFT_1310102 [Galerina marginata CBS 339.88]
MCCRPALSKVASKTISTRPFRFPGKDSSSELHLMLFDIAPSTTLHKHCSHDFSVEGSMMTFMRLFHCKDKRLSSSHQTIPIYLAASLTWHSSL